MAHSSYPSIKPRAILLPLLAIIGTSALMFAIAPGVDVGAISRGVVGPTTWPKAMMLCIIACAVVLLVRNVLTGRMSSQRPEAEPSTPPNAFQVLATTGSADSFEELPREVLPEEYSNFKAALGILLILGYGAGIPTIGFGPATALCIALLLLIGGMRKPVTIGLVSIVGTAALLYLFVKVTAMPLDRGMGYFNDLNLMLYRLIGIY
jgi:putative tricarboxylic transport membrane protein